MEQEFTYKYWHPALTVDNVVFSFNGTQLMVLLIKRLNDPFKNCWAFPGGFVEENETLEEAASRELYEETGIKAIHQFEINAFSAIDRDPRERVITVAYFSVAQNTKPVASDDAQDAQWFSIHNLPSLAFDHAEILKKALIKLRICFHITPIGFELLGKTFTVPEVQRLYTEVFDRKFDRRNFHKRFLKLELIKEVQTEKPTSSHTAKRYCFNEEAYYQLRKKMLKF